MTSSWCLSQVSAIASSSSTSFLPMKTSSSSPLTITTIFSRKLQSKQLTHTAALQRSDKHVLQVSAITNAPRGKGSKADRALMVDPLEAKRLAAKQMQEIQAREKLKRQRQIEAINGAWAMIGLTTGLVIEGQTGHGILAQIAGYFAAILGFFIH